MEKKFKAKMRILFVISIIVFLVGIFNLVKIVAKMLGN